MQTLTLPTPALRWSLTQRHGRRTTRFALHCDPLENRQLLSAGQSVLPGAGALMGPAALGVPVAAAPTAASGVAVSAGSNIANKFGTPAPVSLGQAGFLLDELPNAATSQAALAGIVATTALLNTNPQVSNVTGINLTLTNLSVSALNPDTTSVSAAIIDEQTDSDAFLVPSSMDLLDDHLGVSELPSVIPRVNTNSPGTSNTNTGLSGPSVASLGRNPVPGRGQSFVQAMSLSRGSSTTDDNELDQPGGPDGAPAGEPAPAGGQGTAPATAPQTGGEGAQTPAQGAAKQPVQPAGQNAPSATTPQPAPQGGQNPGAGAAPAEAPQDGQDAESSAASGMALLDSLPPISDAVVDAALDLTDVRVLTRSRDGNASRPDDQPVDTDSSRSFSVVFGAAVVAAGGYHLVLRKQDRSQGRSIPRWQGAERPQ